MAGLPPNMNTAVNANSAGAMQAPVNAAQQNSPLGPNNPLLNQAQAPSQPTQEQLTSMF